MSAVCTCRNAQIEATPTGEKFCRKCGFWWNPEWGSTEPDPSAKEIHPRHRGMEIPVPTHRADIKIGRNWPCPCGSGVKYKRCCGHGR
jgi:hypothetical protein